MDAIGTAAKDRRLLGRFTLLEKIGAGGYGEVWRAQDATLGIEIALKVLSPALARSETAWNDLLHEHEVAGLLDHPSILKVYTPQRDANTAVLPMELAPGGDLRRLRGGSYLQIIPVLLEIAAALEYAHEQGVIHRDLKPGNVLFDAENHALLADFGVAGAGFTAGRDRPRSGLSPFSASPEQLRGEEPAISDDIYGLGALAYELLAGQPPYYPHFDVQRVLEEPVDELRPVQPTPPQLVAIVMRMLDKDPRRRPLTMRAVIDEIDATLNDTLHFEFDSTPEPQRSPREKIAARAAPPPPNPAPGVERNRTPAAPKIVAPTFERRAAPPTRAAPVTKRPPPPAPSPPPPSRPPPVNRTAQASPPATDVVPPLGPAPKMQVEPLPWTFPNMVPASRLMRLEPLKARRWPWIALAGFVAIVVGGFIALPHEPPDVMALIGNPVSPTFAEPQPAAAPAASAGDSQQTTARLIRARTEFDQQMSALEARGADTWGGREFMSARLIAAEAFGAYEAGNPAFAEKRLAAAQEILAAVQKRAPHEAALQLAAGERALAADRTQVAKQAFESALRIDPTSRKAQDALQRLRDPNSARAVLADAGGPTSQQAEPVRAVQDTARTVALDPQGTQGSSEPAPRERGAVAEDGYTRAVAAGSAAMDAGRLAEARAAFEKALSYNPNGHDAADGLAHVVAVLRARGVEGTHQRAAALEAQERWDEALNEYEAALSVDPTLGYAQQGKVRVAARALLAQRLQALIDRPERLAAPEERRAALGLIASASEQSPSGPVLRSQIARLQILLPEFDKLVQLALISDDATQIAIPSIGFRGTFARRVIELKPGKYTVVGTRQGYREVRRDITISPGADTQTISVTCGEPI
jgi:eukaryotic-like serine/threonine-protein kinase